MLFKEIIKDLHPPFSMTTLNENFGHSIKGTPCMESEDWNLDECIINQLEEKSLKEIGCVTPFGNTKEHICEEPNKGK